MLTPEQEAKSNRAALTKLREALRPFAAIVDAYEDNQLDEVRPDWGVPLEEAKKTELLTSWDHKVLLTLGDCYKAKEAMKG